MRNKRVCDYIAEAIQNEILSGRMSSGVPLRQEELADSLGYSRIPIREALQILESQGLAKRLATRHVVVADFSDEVITEIYELLSSLSAITASQRLPKYSPKSSLTIFISLSEYASAIFDNSSSLRTFSLPAAVSSTANLI